MSGVNPPMNRPDIQTTPWAMPRSVIGNQLCRQRVIFGNAPASPTPNRNRMTTSVPSPNAGSMPTQRPSKR